MSARQDLVALLARFDDEALAALASRGLLRRARKDLETVVPVVAEERDDELTVAVGPHHIRLDRRGPAHASCTCAASECCQHVLAATLWLQGQAVDEGPRRDDGGEADPIDDLRASLLRMSPAEMIAHAGKAGFRWAWQFVSDLDLERSVTIRGDRHVVIDFDRPRASFRYMGGGLDGVLADVDLAGAAKYRVAAVLVFQRAHGVELAPPEPARSRTRALDLGVDHRRIDAAPEALDDSRRRLRASLAQLLAESVELGLSHLSGAIHERFATLATWAQGVEYFRLALLLRRIADHVELLNERAGGADEHRLLDEMSVALALASALDAADARGQAPAHLVGRARTRYDESRALELWGLGASAWRSASGYSGLTMIFWSPADRAFLSCTDARPLGTPGFDPVARHAAAGPWAGLGAPAQAAGRRIVLTGARLSDAGRLSASENTSAIVMADPPGSMQAVLEPVTSWRELARERGDRARSVLAQPDPMRDWVVLRPARFEPARFDAVRQALAWALHDENDDVIVVEVAYDELARHAIERIEAFAPGRNDAGILVVGRIRPGTQPLVLEPLSLVRPDAAPAGRVVDALHFDPEPRPGFVSKVVAKLRRGATGGGAPPGPVRRPDRIDVVRQAIRAQAERGIPGDRAAEWHADASGWAETASAAGVTSFRALRREGVRPGECLLRMGYVCLQHDRMIGETTEAIG